MTKEEIKERVITMLVDEMEMDASLLKDDAHLIHDLGMTSLDMLDAKAFMRREYGFTPVVEDMFGIQTLNDLYEYIFEHQNDFVGGKTN